MRPQSAIALRARVSSRPWPGVTRRKNRLLLAAGERAHINGLCGVDPFDCSKPQRSLRGIDGPLYARVEKSFPKSLMPPDSVQARVETGRFYHSAAQRGASSPTISLLPTEESSSARLDGSPTARPLYVKLELRAMTNSASKRT